MFSIFIFLTFYIFYEEAFFRPSFMGQDYLLILEKN
jgi:hypothetical protein